MENLSPTLVLIWDVLRAIESGNSANKGLQQYILRSIEHSFHKGVQKWWSQLLINQPAPQLFADTVLKRQLLHLIKLGHNGESIYEPLKALEVELILSCEDEINQHLALLPFKMLFPLFFFIMPAVMIVLIVPLLDLIQF